MLAQAFSSVANMYRTRGNLQSTRAHTSTRAPWSSITAPINARGCGLHGEPLHPLPTQSTTESIACEHACGPSSDNGGTGDGGGTTTQQSMAGTSTGLCGHGPVHAAVIKRTPGFIDAITIESSSSSSVCDTSTMPALDDHMTSPRTRRWPRRRCCRIPSGPNRRATAGRR
jgi:hypothetical protein